MKFNGTLEVHYRKNFTVLVKKYSRGRDIHTGEDIVQEAYCRALERQEEYDPAFAFATWFETKILPGERINNARRERKHSDQSIETMLADGIEEDIDKAAITMPPSPELASYVNQLLRLISTKPDDIRTVLHDALILGESYATIGHRVRRSANAVELIVRRFRKEMQNEDSVPRY